MCRRSRSLFRCALQQRAGVDRGRASQLEPESSALARPHPVVVTLPPTGGRSAAPRHDRARSPPPMTNPLSPYLVGLWVCVPGIWLLGRWLADATESTGTTRSA